MKTLIKKVRGKEVSRKSGYKTEQDALNAAGSWMNDCTVHSTERVDRSTEVISTKR